MIQPNAPESGPSQASEAPVHKQAEWSKLIRGIPGFKGLTEIISNPRDLLPHAGTAAKTTSLLLAAGIIVNGLPFFEKFTNNLQLGPQQASAESMQGSNQRTEKLQVIEDRLEFTVGADRYTWDWTNATGGRPPQNDPDITTATMRVAKNGQWIESGYFQGLQELYPKPLIFLGIGGAAVNVPRDTYYLVTATGRNDGKNDIFVETGKGVRTPEQYTGREIVALELPSGGKGGKSTLTSLERNDKGEVLRIIITDAVDPAGNGTWEYQLDEQGNIIGKAVHVSTTPGAPYRIFLPYTPKGAN